MEIFILSPPEGGILSVEVNSPHSTLQILWNGGFGSQKDPNEPKGGELG